MNQNIFSLLFTLKSFGPDPHLGGIQIWELALGKLGALKIGSSRIWSKKNMTILFFNGKLVPFSHVCPQQITLMW